MEELIKNVILKYTMIKVENSEQNLLDLPVVEECWIYVIMELENTYNLPIIKLLDDIKVDEFNLQTICDKLHTATFRGHQGRVLRPDRAILSGQS